MNESIVEASRLVQSVLMASPNGVLVLQPVFGVGGTPLDLFLRAINSVAREDLDHPATEVLGQSVRTHFPQLADKEAMATYWQVIGTKKPVRFKTRSLQLNQAQTRLFAISAVPLENDLLITYNEIAPFESDSSLEI
ncbi:hypothetical protein [Spirosoma sp.]|uniref:hypothetical protein n=1 Tax=Spirosoma sp. TaxID=1899569 RepID=UPI00260DE100|nr:hypothetical protein [Spirosoma sp.]MCX6215329.1 hypothetical protein [Spirosoma sp.]